MPAHTSGLGTISEISERGLIREGLGMRHLGDVALGRPRRGALGHRPGQASVKPWDRFLKGLFRSQDEAAGASSSGPGAEHGGKPTQGQFKMLEAPPSPRPHGTLQGPQIPQVPGSHTMCLLWGRHHPDSRCPPQGGRGPKPGSIHPGHRPQPHHAQHGRQCGQWHTGPNSLHP